MLAEQDERADQVSLLPVPVTPDSGSHRTAGGQGLGGWLRRQREERFWTRAEMARQLIAAARAHGDALPGPEHVAHNIYRWERGLVAPHEPYRLYYCKALGILLDAFGAPGPADAAAPAAAPAPAVTAGTVLAFLDAVAALWQDMMCPPDAEQGPGRG